MSESCLSAEQVLEMERNLRDQIDTLESKIKSLEALIAEKSAALDKYGRHGGTCQAGIFVKTQCDCGFDQALKSSSGSNLLEEQEKLKTLISKIEANAGNYCIKCLAKTDGTKNLMDEMKAKDEAIQKAYRAFAKIGDDDCGCPYSDDGKSFNHSHHCHPQIARDALALLAPLVKK